MTSKKELLKKILAELQASNYNSEKIKVLSGIYGPYINYNNKNYRINNKYQPSSINLNQVLDIINNKKYKK